MGNDSDNNDTATWQLTVSDPTDSNRTTLLRASGSFYHDAKGDDAFVSVYSGGIRLAQSAIDSIQFFMSDGGIASGTFSVYGIGD